MSIYLVRHAKAGSRSDWHGDDAARPLSANGRKQADAIAAHLSTGSLTALYASASLRCRQTLEPLALATDLDVMVDDRLAEGTPFEVVLAMLAEVPDGAVLCSHGDVIPEAIGALQRRGCAICGRPDWRKGTVWTIERSADGTFVTAKVWAPPH